MKIINRLVPNCCYSGTRYQTCVEASLEEGGLVPTVTLLRRVANVGASCRWDFNKTGRVSVPATAVLPAP